MNLDIKTIIINCLVINIIASIYVFFIWIKYRKNYNGLSRFLLAMILLSAGTLLLSLQNVAHDFYSIVLSNTLNIVGMSFMYYGFSKYFNQKKNHSIFIFSIIVPVIVFFFQIKYSLLTPSLLQRIILITMAFVIFFVLILISIYKNRQRAGLPGALLFVFILFLSIVLILRIIVSILEVNGNYLFELSGYHSFSFIVWSIVIATMPIGYALMIANDLNIKSESRAEEKSILLQELFHRTKNNMSVIMSLLEWHDYNDKEIKIIPVDEYVDRMDVIRGRIEAISLVHDLLFSSKNLSKINIKLYFQNLVDSIKECRVDRHYDVEINYKIQDITLVMDIAVSLGLIVNEIITNVFKHAFPKNYKGVIDFEFSKNKNEEFFLIIKDNGVGLPDELINRTDFGNTGMKLIRLLAEKQLRGKLTCKNENGFICSVAF